MSSENNFILCFSISVFQTPLLPYLLTGRFSPIFFKSPCPDKLGTSPFIKGGVGGDLCKQ